METKFKIGQVWRTRGDGTMTIKLLIPNIDYPIRTVEEDSYTDEGHYFAGEEGPDERDLIELVQDVADAKPKVIAEALLKDAAHLMVPGRVITKSPTERNSATESELTLFDNLVMEAARRGDMSGGLSRKAARWVPRSDPTARAMPSWRARLNFNPVSMDFLMWKQRKKPLRTACVETEQ